MNYRDIAKAAKKQGWRVEPTRSGEMWFSPNGVDKVTWHKTPSDARAVRNFLAEMKRGGLIYPPPK